MGVNQKFEYSFKCVNPEDYELELVFHAKNRLIREVFSKSIRRIKRKKGLDVSGDPEVVEAFDIPVEDKYLNLIKTFVTKPVGIIRKEVNEDGIDFLNHAIKKTYFKRNVKTNDWDIFVVVHGQFVDKR